MRNLHLISRDNAIISLNELIRDNDRQLEVHYSNSGPGCSKLTTSLVNVSLNFQKLISQIGQYFLLKKCEKLLQCKSFSQFFEEKFQCIWL